MASTYSGCQLLGFPITTYSFMVNLASIKCEKSLKIPEGESESVNRRTEITMAKIKGTKGQTTIYKTHIKLKIE